MMSFHHSNLAVSPFGRRMRINFLQKRNFFFGISFFVTVDVVCARDGIATAHSSSSLESSMEQCRAISRKKSPERRAEKRLLFRFKSCPLLLMLSRFLISIDFSCPRRRSSIIRQAELSSLRKISNDEISELDFHSFFEHLRFAAVAQN